MTPLYGSKEIVGATDGERLQEFMCQGRCNLASTQFNRQHDSRETILNAK
jgi:hypothetical protein